MDLDPDEQLELIIETARRFGENEMLPRMREAERNRCVGSDVRRAFDETGLGGLELPGGVGGAALGSVARVLVNEEFGAADPGAALALDRIGPALYPLLELGTDPVGLLEGISGNDERILLVTESDGPWIVRNDVVHGTVPWVPADRADAIVILTCEGAGLVRQDFSIDPVRGAGLRAAGAGTLRFDDAPLLGAAFRTDREAADRALARARLHVASLLLGVMRAACDFSRDYAQARQAFGRPIAHHQALAFLITDMQMALDGARLLVHEAAWRLDAGLPAAATAASAHAECIDASRSIGPNAVQILGGHGFMADYPVEKHMREARALGLLFGGFDSAIEDAGRRICREARPLEIGLGGAL